MIGRRVRLPRMKQRLDPRWPLLRIARAVTSRLPRLARMEGLACRILTLELLAAGRGRTAHARVNGAAYDLSLADYVEAKAWITGRQDNEVLKFCQMHLPHGGLAIDVGANVGFITVPLAKHAQEVGGRVIAIEPLPRNIERLARHAAYAGVERSVEVVACAVGDAPGQVKMTVAAESGFTSNGVASRLHEDLFAVDADSPRVAVDTLDAICERRGIGVIDVIKIDVEGFEPFVLRGAKALLERGAIRAGIIEINDQLLALRGWDRKTLLGLLRESGLRPEPLEPGGDLQVDVDVAFRAERRSDAAREPRVSSRSRIDAP